MLYRIIGNEVSTHRRVELTNWDAPDIATAKRFATEIGIAVSKIEPMNGPTQEQCEPARDTPASDTSDNTGRSATGASWKAPETEAMSLINCPVCQKPVCEAANACPGCGFTLTPDAVAVQKAEKVKKQKTEQRAADRGWHLLGYVHSLLGGAYIAALIVVNATQRPLYSR